MSINTYLLFLSFNPFFFFKTHIPVLSDCICSFVHTEAIDLNFYYTRAQGWELFYKQDPDPRLRYVTNVRI